MKKGDSAPSPEHLQHVQMPTPVNVSFFPGAEGVVGLLHLTYTDINSFANCTLEIGPHSWFGSLILLEFIVVWTVGV